MGFATKSFERASIFRYGLPKDILSKGQKTIVPPNPMHLRVKALKSPLKENGNVSTPISQKTFKY